MKAKVKSNERLLGNSLNEIPVRLLRARPNNAGADLIPILAIPMVPSINPAGLAARSAPSIQRSSGSRVFAILEPAELFVTSDINELLIDYSSVSSMMEELDPEIVASMGFTSFGAPPNQKKRKYNHNAPDAVVNVSSGANATVVVGARPRLSAEIEQTSMPEGSTVETPTNVDSMWKRIEGKKMEELGSDELKALRQGIKNENGDSVYFKLSFLEDPWAEKRT